MALVQRQHYDSRAEIALRRCCFILGCSIFGADQKSADEDRRRGAQLNPQHSLLVVI